MATLTNLQINNTYPGLIKTTDNAALDPTVEKQLTDGIGNNMPMTASQAGVSFNGNLDLTNATITGLNGGGLVAGAGLDSMNSSAALTTTAANASGANSIALGEGARAASGQAIAIGRDAECLTSDSIVIGTGCNSSNGPSVTIGRNASANGSVSTAVGNSASVSADQSIGISGENITVSGARSVGLGRQVRITTANSIAIGNFAKVSGNASMSFTSCTVDVNDQKAANSLMMIPGSHGCLTAPGATNSIALGSSSSNLERVQAAGAIAIGYDTQASNLNSIALGANASAQADGAVGINCQGAIADTVSVQALEVQDSTNGIIMSSPNGTQYRLTVSDAGALVIAAV